MADTLAQEPALSLEVREKCYPAQGEVPAHVALRDVHFGLPPRQFACLLGPSGCGKTTLLNIIAGLDQAFDGRVLTQAADRPPRLGYVFQEPRLLPWRSVIDNIRIVLQNPSASADRIEALLEATGLDRFRHNFPGQLSLGMSRRVALVRAFAVEPELLLMDEPFVSLDNATAQRLRDLLLRIWQERPTTVLFVTHNLDEAIYLADRIISLSPAPAQVVGDVAVDLPRADRRDPDRLAAFRKQLGAANGVCPDIG